jgi:hypothetical protein
MTTSDQRNTICALSASETLLARLYESAAVTGARIAESHRLVNASHQAIAKADERIQAGPHGLPPL